MALPQADQISGSRRQPENSISTMQQRASPPQLGRQHSPVGRGGGPGALMPPTGTTADDVDELDRLARPTLTRRKDFIDKEEEARKSPNRVLYFRRNADYDRLIEVCSRKISENPRNVRALLIRASSNLKKGASALPAQPAAPWGRAWLLPAPDARARTSLHAAHRLQGGGM